MFRVIFNMLAYGLTGHRVETADRPYEQKIGDHGV